ncbi:hypothetical protein E8E13_000009, partial [Curvularia kusanoi]
MPSLHQTLLLLTISTLSLPIQTIQTPSPTPPPSPLNPLPTACNADNCLRALRRNAPSAIPFCSTYTTSPVPSTSLTPTIPNWAANCQNNPTRVTTPLIPVYGPTDNTNYTLFSSATNIRSRPETWEEAL